MESHTIKNIKGGIINGWMWVDFEDQVNVLVEDARKKFIVIKQEKYGIHGSSLSVVSGAISITEKPVEAAARELLDELQVVCSSHNTFLYEIKHIPLPPHYRYVSFVEVLGYFSLAYMISDGCKGACVFRQVSY